MKNDATVLIADHPDAVVRAGPAKDLAALFRSVPSAEGMRIGAPESPRRSDLLKAVADAEFLVCLSAKIDGEVIAAGRRLKLIHNFGLRHENIDLHAAKTAGIPVAITSHLGAVAVAELTFTLVLALSKRLLRAHNETAAGLYEELGLKPTRTSESKISFKWTELPGIFEVHGRRFGIVGLGEIGTELALRARAFGMEIVYYKRNRLSDGEERKLGARYLGLDDLLKESDFVALLVPHTPETESMIGKRELSLMKPTAFLINTCRGGVVDERALCGVLKAGSISGAGLDVFVDEPLPKESPLTKLDNVILTPHIGGGSSTGFPRTAEAILSNIRRVMRGTAPVDVLT